MEMTRRRFGALIAAAGLAGGAGFRRAAATMRDARFVRAVRARVFPGSLRPLDDTRMDKPSKWAG
jgi:hypothetical protein